MRRAERSAGDRHRDAERRLLPSRFDERPERELSPHSMFGVRFVMSRLKSGSPVFFVGLLALLPLLIPSPDSGSDHFIGLIGREGSAKEAIMATQEIVEHLELDSDAEEAAVDELWLVRQIARVLNLYALGQLLSMGHRMTLNVC